MFRIAVTLVLAMGLSACAAGSANTASTRTADAGGFRAPPTSNAAGLKDVLGKQAPALSRRFGQARIDLSEGDARKLQFVSDRCVLDIFLYPPSANAEPIATFVEARTRDNGTDTDRAGCIKEVERAANRQ